MREGRILVTAGQADRRIAAVDIRLGQDHSCLEEGMRLLIEEDIDLEEEARRSLHAEAEDILLGVVEDSRCAEADLVEGMVSRNLARQEDSLPTEADLAEDRRTW